MFSIAQNAGEPDAVGRFKLLVPRYGITAVTVPTNMFTGRDLNKPFKVFTSTEKASTRAFSWLKAPIKLSH